MRKPLPSDSRTSLSFLRFATPSPLLTLAHHGFTVSACVLYFFRFRESDSSFPPVLSSLSSFVLALCTGVLRPFAPAALPAFFATTASADFSAILTAEISPGKVQNLSPRAVWLYPLRLDDLGASLFFASSPPALGLAASSCSYGRWFAIRFFQLHLAATPCGFATVAIIGPHWLLSSN